MSRAGGRRDIAALAVITGASVALAVHSSWGVDLRDSTYAHGLSVRWANGEFPFRDEVSPHAWGAWPVAPFLMLWQFVVGSEGIILAGRVAYAALAGLAAFVAWRLLRERLGDLSAAMGLATLMLALPYAIGVTSYNTTAMMLLVVFWAALYGVSERAQLTRERSAAAIISGVGAGLSHPAVGVVVLLLLCCALCAGGRLGPDRRSAARVSAGVATLGAGLVGVAALGAGTTKLLEMQSTVMGQRSPLGSMGRWWVNYAEFLAGSRILALAILLGVLCTAARLVGATVLGLLAAPLLVGAFVIRFGSSNVPEPTAGSFAGAAAVLLVLVLFIPSAYLVRARQPLARPLLITAAPAAVVGAVVISVMSMAHPRYGAVMVAAGPLLVVVVASVARALGDYRVSMMWLALVFPLVMMGSLTAVVFNEGPVVGLDRVIQGGPAAGLRTGSTNEAADSVLRELLRKCAGPRSEVAIIGAPGAYAWLEPHMRPATNQLWNEGADVTALAKSVRSAGAPDCFIAPEGDNAFGVGGDELKQGLREHYRSVASGPLGVLDPSGRTWQFTAWQRRAAG